MVRMRSARRPRFPTPNCTAKRISRFLEGASHPDELVARAAELGYRRWPSPIRNTLAGVVRAHVAAKEFGLKLLIGAEITPDDAPPVVLCATDRAAYGRLSRLITLRPPPGRKGEFQVALADVADHADGLLAGVGSPRRTGRGASIAPCRYREVFGDRCHLLAELFLRDRRSPAARLSAGRRPAARACRWWPPATFTITLPPAGRCRTC